MKRLIIPIFVLAMTFFSGLQTGCEGDRDVCQEFCDAARDCYELNLQWFSTSKCMRECHDQREGYSLVGCKRAFEELKECQTDLSCSAWGDVGDRCAYEVDRFNDCIK